MQKPVNVDGVDYYSIPAFVKNGGFMLEKEDFNVYDNLATQMSWMAGKKVVYVKHHSYFFVRAYDVEVLKELFESVTRYA